MGLPDRAIQYQMARGELWVVLSPSVFDDGLKDLMFLRLRVNLVPMWGYAWLTMIP